MSLMDQFKSLPPVTRTVLLGAVLTTGPVLLALTDLYPIVFIPNRVFGKAEIWRLVTPFLYAGGGIPLIFDLFLLYRNLNDLEERHFQRRTADTAWMMMLVCSMIMAINYPLRNPLFFRALLLGLTHLWAQTNPTNKVSLFGLITMPAPYFPFALLGIDLVKGGPGAALFGFTGVAAAHVYYFLAEIYPRQNGGRGLSFLQTPQFLIDQLGNGAPPSNTTGAQSGPGSGSGPYRAGGGWGFRPSGGQRLGGVAGTGWAILRPQLPVGYESFETQEGSQWTTFEHPIKTVAIIGAGPAGLQAAAALSEHNFTIRLFDRQDTPGGNWYYQDAVPFREAYPDRPAPVGAYVPETPGVESRLYSEGDGGLSLDERWREHTRPSPVWNALHTNSPAVITELPDAPYPKDSPWVISAHQIQRHIRAFASIHSLNSNDRPTGQQQSSATSYATRVELLKKKGDKWTLSLRKLERVSHDKIRASWWTEDFDAVVVATGNYDSPHVPEIKGLKAWSEVVRSDGSHPVWHSQAYRRPEPFKGKNVLLIGASVSASEISRELGPVTDTLWISIRNNTNRAAHFLNRSIRRISPEALKVDDIAEFEPLPLNAEGIEGGRVRLLNGTVLTGVDEVILATGFRRSNPFLRDYIAKSDGEERGVNAPILSLGGLTSLHWWTVGRYQSLGFARVWAGLARIPNRKELWKQYEGSQGDKASPAFYGTLKSEFIFRQFINWLNGEAFENGGRFVDAWPVESREWANGYISSANFTEAENTPARKVLGGSSDDKAVFWHNFVSDDLDW
ncbi:hypothetical protein MNV49_000342 [Pseudohyphozyma bogoriensis]|nr:hypothetical protein MNV49_000342 [Pseudohyphozyma bogoriensis]